MVQRPRWTSYHTIYLRFTPHDCVYGHVSFFVARLPLPTSIGHRRVPFSPSLPLHDRTLYYTNLTLFKIEKLISAVC